MNSGQYPTITATFVYLQYAMHVVEKQKQNIRFCESWTTDFNMLRVRIMSSSLKQLVKISKYLSLNVVEMQKQNIGILERWITHFNMVKTH